MYKAAIIGLLGLALAGIQPASAEIGVGALGRLVTQPSWTDGIAHKVIMRGQIIDIQDGVPVVCLGSGDGIKVGQIFEVYRVQRRHSNGKTPGQVYRRDFTGHVKIDRIFDEHFARAVVTAGSPAINDVVELHLQP